MRSAGDGRSPRRIVRGNARLKALARAFVEGRRASTNPHVIAHHGRTSARIAASPALMFRTPAPHIGALEQAAMESSMIAANKADNLRKARVAAWKTRRAKYGPAGHNGGYSRPCTHCSGAVALVIRLHNEGTLSEGQVAKALNLDRVAVRKLADEALQRKIISKGLSG